MIDYPVMNMSGFRFAKRSVCYWEQIVTSSRNASVTITQRTEKYSARKLSTLKLRRLCLDDTIWKLESNHYQKNKFLDVSIFWNDIQNAE